MSSREQLIEVCRSIVAPIIEADDGELYLVTAEDALLALHLEGKCSGCPGASITIQSVIVPTIQRVVPNAQVTVTVGIKRPAGAERLTGLTEGVAGEGSA